MTIRPLAPTDSIPELTALLHLAYGELAARGFRFHATFQDETVTLERANEGVCFVALDGGTLVGTIAARPPAPEDSCPFYREPGVWAFGQFAVHPEHQGAGLGRKLLSAVEEEARRQGAHTLALDTAEGAHDLIAMYERWGFVLVGHVDWRPFTNYLSVVMRKELGG